MATTAPNQKVIVLDFGAQYGQLIARRVRDLGVYSEIVPCDESAEKIAEMKPSAIILSGGPASVYADDAPKIDPAVLELGVPILGFCYGHQTIAVELGGTVGHTEKGEYGSSRLTCCWRSAVRRYPCRANSLDESRRGSNRGARWLHGNRFHRHLPLLQLRNALSVTSSPRSSIPKLNTPSSATRCSPTSCLISRD